MTVIVVAVVEDQFICELISIFPARTKQQSLHTHKYLDTNNYLYSQRASTAAAAAAAASDGAASLPQTHRRTLSTSSG